MLVAGGASCGGFGGSARAGGGLGPYFDCDIATAMGAWGCFGASARAGGSGGLAGPVLCFAGVAFSGGKPPVFACDGGAGIFFGGTAFGGFGAGTEGACCGRLGGKSGSGGRSWPRGLLMACCEAKQVLFSKCLLTCEEVYVYMLFFSMEM